MIEKSRSTTTRGVSVVICCYNSAPRLPETLRHLAAMEAPISGGLEILIVDNCSTDGTAKVAAELWRALNSPYELTIVQEPSPGLTNARIKGFRVARHDIIVFCDDDNWLCTTYARTAQAIVDGNSRIALAGGMTEPVFESEKLPSWFSELAGAYAVGGTEEQCEVKIGDFVWGAGMVARREALVRLFDSGFKFLCADRRGSSLTGGGDIEMCHALQWLGYTIYHDGTLKLKHWIPKERLTWNYVVRMAKGWGAATISEDPLRVVQNRRQPFRNTVRRSFVYHLIRGGIALIPQLKNLAIVQKSEGNITALDALSKWGRWQAIAGLNIDYSRLIAEKAAWLDRTKPAISATATR